MKELNKLKELTHNLPAVPTLKEMIHNPGNIRSYIEYEVEEGTAIGFGLLNQKEIAVQKLFLSKGTIFPTHYHLEEHEFIVVFQGSLEIEESGFKHVLKEKDCVKLEAGKNHKGLALEDCWIIVISIPSIEGYPK